MWEKKTVRIKELSSKNNPTTENEKLTNNSFGIWTKKLFRSRLLLGGFLCVLISQNNSCKLRELSQQSWHLTKREAISQRRQNSVISLVSFFGKFTFEATNMYIYLHCDFIFLVCILLLSCSPFLRPITLLRPVLH